MFGFGHFLEKEQEPRKSKVTGDESENKARYRHIQVDCSFLNRFILNSYKSVLRNEILYVYEYGDSKWFLFDLHRAECQHHPMPPAFSLFQ